MAEAPRRPSPLASGATPHLMQTPMARPLTAVFAPLGRMALTNYLTATVVVLVAGRNAQRRLGTGTVVKSRASTTSPS